MKLICSLFFLLALHQATGAVVKKPPAFATPVYSDSYVPAAIQVIFHAVEQLKLVEEEEATHNTTRASVSSTVLPSSPTQGEQANAEETSSTAAAETMTKPVQQGQEKIEATNGGETEQQMESSTKADQTSFGPSAQPTTTELLIESTSSDYQESPEINEETPEANYATPETNYESPEAVYGVQETNQEVPEENQEQGNNFSTEMSQEVSGSSGTEASATASDAAKKKQLTIDSIVEEIYEIVKPTNSVLTDEEVSLEESKSATGMTVEKIESIEEEEEETRFTLLGEKVAQVPRPSLSSYLRRAKVPPSPTLQQLGSLYDALSKDARKQGFGKYTGYSDEVLGTLVTSVEGGIAPQLQKILQKVMKRNELTRSDARGKVTETLKAFDNPSSNLNKDLRPLLPLRFSP